MLRLPGVFPQAPDRSPIDGFGNRQGVQFIEGAPTQSEQLAWAKRLRHIQHQQAATKAPHMNRVKALFQSGTQSVKLIEFWFQSILRLDTEAFSRRVQERLMKTGLTFWKGFTVPEASRSIELLRLFKRSCLISTAVLCLSDFQHEARAQTVISQCTNPVCTPGKACALYRCVDPRTCLDCAPSPSNGSSCEVGYALGNHANFAGGNVPDVLIESTDYWTIDDYGDVWYDGFSTTGPVQETTITLPPSCIQTSGSFVLEDPIDEYEGAIAVGTFAYEGLETQCYAWPQVLYDDGDRSFINVIDPDGNIDFYQCPWLSLGAYLVTGVDASNGDLFEGNGTVELLIVADVSA